MTKEFLEERINSLVSKISKSNNIIAKKEALIAKKAESHCETSDPDEKYWIECDIENLRSDIQAHENYIVEYTKKLEQYKAELNKITSIKRDIPVLVEFLNNWKEKVTNYYLKERDGEERRSFRKEVSTAYSVYAEYRNSASYSKLDQDRIAFLRASYKELDRAYLAKYAYVLNLEDKAQYHGTTFEEELEKELQRDWEIKYDDLLNRITEVVGNITDASNLSISPKGNIDGCVIGDKGKAKVDTIPAGGYNIQIAHWRTLVHKID